ncbi:aminopeptidase P family protein [Cognatishimia sp. MH4019]|uniref:aminopeptidase P family protein n=1 Tax=Cognatishimia sp. MH4019 TaxID=2854030 RepID=UPI001CD34236|nr:aminopeptidase P family protein [Cognatishimia sp. MH4019]
MFQTFTASTSPDDGPPRLAALRAAMKNEGVDGFLVPRADAHQGEYVAPRDARLAWLTGFTGSAGFAAILADHAGVFIDGRYRVQVKSQVADVFTPVPWPETKLADWLIQHLPTGATVGFDDWLHTQTEVDRLREALAQQEITLTPIGNLVDRIWQDQPAPPSGKMIAYPLEFAGESHADKRARIASDIEDAGQDAAVLTLPDSIAWLLNIRGTDIERNPVAHAFAILHKDATLDLYVHGDKAADLGAHLGDDIRLHPVAEFEEALAALKGTIRVDPATAPARIFTQITAEIARADDPCILPKACKNATEIEGARTAHLRDAAAMVEFLAWLDAQAPGSLTEIAVVKELEARRRATNALRDISFETISGAGPNAAIVHYRVTEDTDRVVKPGELLLVDSGGQYIDGTTDITRTVPIGPPEDIHRSCFTRVLQGMIAISRARFPKGLAGRDLDALARFPLWTAGLDYDHGTGHGVGVYLSVHEGPQRISRISDVALKPGMILSNEPGYYREGAFGIRIENLITVRKAPAIEGADAREMLDFETLTFVPIDRRLIVADMLSPDERAWINAYHQTVFDKIADNVGAEARDWLERATAPV